MLGVGFEVWGLGCEVWGKRFVVWGVRSYLVSVLQAVAVGRPVPVVNVERSLGLSSVSMYTPIAVEAAINMAVEILNRYHQGSWSNINIQDRHSIYSWTLQKFNFIDNCLNVFHFYDLFLFTNGQRWWKENSWENIIGKT